jgi:bifunctional NMN adenylyltransferase/nudix hydrolase
MAHITRAREHDICVFIGRFQPLHAGHMGVILKALEYAEFLFILIGSANVARRPDANPFFAAERIEMLLASLPPEARERVIFIPMEDSDYETIDWVNAVNRAVTTEAIKIMGKLDSSISLIGHSKDHTSFYLKLFPQWNTIDVVSSRPLDATILRNQFFTGNTAVVDNMFRYAVENQDIPLGAINWLRDFQKLDVYGELVEEMEFYRSCHARWDAESWPASRNTVTGDALILQSNHVLLIQRGEFPQKGTWGMPGGHTNTNETVADSALREGYEETGIKVPKIVFEKAFVGKDYFDAPRRDPRGRYIGHVFMYHLQPSAPSYDTTKSPVENRRRVKDALSLPKVKGMDDAMGAKWWHLDDLKRSEMFLDHYSIIRKMTAQFGKGN